VTNRAGCSGRWRALATRHPELFSLVGLVVLCVAMALVTDRFFSWENFSNIGRQVSINAIIAVGMTIVIITGGIDLSVGAVMTLSMTVAAGAMLSSFPVVISIALGIGTGLLFGAINGALVAYARLPAIIVTLGTLYLYRGLTFIASGAKQIDRQYIPGPLKAMSANSPPLIC